MARHQLHDRLIDRLTCNTNIVTVVYVWRTTTEQCTNARQLLQ